MNKRLQKKVRFYCIHVDPNNYLVEVNKVRWRDAWKFAKRVANKKQAIIEIDMWSRRKHDVKVFSTIHPTWDVYPDATTPNLTNQSSEGNQRPNEGEVV